MASEKSFITLPPRMLGQIADQVAKTVLDRLPQVLHKKKPKGKTMPAGRQVENALFLDTSAIIDGRILDVARLGFLIGSIILPEFILLELKHIADSKDSLKRARGRRGLEILSKLKKIKELKVKVTRDDAPDSEIDEKLISIARDYKGKIITCDFNLNKKATLFGIQILNVNELANALKTNVLPGEELKVKIVQEGKEKGQGVGYLLDGTMIVVERGQEVLGEVVDVIVSRIFQTEAGRMVFSKLKEN